MLPERSTHPQYDYVSTNMAEVEKQKIILISQATTIITTVAVFIVVMLVKNHVPLHSEYIDYAMNLCRFVRDMINAMFNTIGLQIQVSHTLIITLAGALLGSAFFLGMSSALTHLLCRRYMLNSGSCKCGYQYVTQKSGEARCPECGHEVSSTIIA
jgi:hypothetical protein